MKKLLALFIIAQLSFAAYAQESPTNDALREMNTVKMSGNYVWAEGTSMKNEKEALENAVTVLTYEIQNQLNVSDDKDISGVVMPTSDQCMKIQSKRGNLFRAFVYVKKSSIVTLKKEEKAVIVERSSNNYTQKEPKNIDGGKNVKESRPQSTAEAIYEPNDFEKQMLAITKASDIEAFVKQSSIAKFGKYKERPADGEYYLIVYNREGTIPACLKFEKGKLTNVASGAEDSFQNYKGCGAYWFMQK